MRFASLITGCRSGRRFYVGDRALVPFGETLEILEIIVQRFVQQRSVAMFQYPLSTSLVERLVGLFYKQMVVFAQVSVPLLVGARLAGTFGALGSVVIALCFHFIKDAKKLVRSVDPVSNNDGDRRVVSRKHVHRRHHERTRLL